MRRIYFLLVFTLLLIGCKGGKKAVVSDEGQRVATGAGVLAREVPERMDDFVFENDLIAGRFYGKALEGDPTSPGIDVWVKMPGALVADDWYSHAVSDAEYYHHDHGGKDCYKVSVSLGGGASVPVVGGKLCYPATNWRESAVLARTDGMVTFVLKYPEWQVGDLFVRLEKTVTVTAGSYFCRVEDRYYGNFDSLDIAAGLWVHDPDNALTLKGSDGKHFVSLWEPASDQSVEPEDGMLGLAVIMPDARETTLLEDDGKTHTVCLASVKSGEPLTYWFGSCWSKGDIKDFQQWSGAVYSMLGSVR